MNLARRPLKTITEMRRLLPGEAEMLSNKQLGHRSPQQRLTREHLRTVTFSNGIAEVHVSVIASTDLKAVQKARRTKRLATSWKAKKIADKKGLRPYTGRQK